MVTASCRAVEALAVHAENPVGKGGITSWWNLRWLCYLHHKRKTQGYELPRKKYGSVSETPVPAEARGP